MKTTLFTLILATAFLISCADQPVSPSDPQNNSYTLIKLPPKKPGLSIETVFSHTELIDGAKGGNIKIDEKYIAADGHDVKIKGEIKFKKDSFVGEKYITYIIDDEYAAISFSPSMVFDVPVELKLKFEGIDVNELSLVDGDYDFIYIGDDGHIELVESNGVHVNGKDNKIEVNKALLNHFSRYAFSR